MKLKRSLAALSAAGALLCVAAIAPAFAQSGPPPSHASARQGKAPEQSFPEQSSVATKSSFSTIDAGDKHVKTAMNATDLAGAGKLIGKNGSFEGTVSQVYSPRDHDIAILDFAKDYHSAVTVIVKPANYAKLPNLKGLVGKHVVVTGKVSAYEGRPQMEITTAKQLKIVR